MCFAVQSIAIFKPQFICTVLKLIFLYYYLQYSDLEEGISKIISRPVMLYKCV